MNIEEERKAFQQYTANIYKDDFGIWLAAKVHATEMAKPTVKILPSRRPADSTSYPFVLSLFVDGTFNGVLEDFSTKEAAEQWAKANGYRVIE